MTTMECLRAHCRRITILFLVMILFTNVCSGKIHSKKYSWIISRKPIQPWPSEIQNPTRIYIFPGLTTFVQRIKNIFSQVSLYDLQQLEHDPNNVVIQDIGSLLTKVAYQEFGLALRWQFCLYKDDTVNAFAFPTGKIAIFSGLINHLVEGEEKGQFTDVKAILAFVMAHEIGHLVARHHQGTTPLALSVGLVNVFARIYEKLFGSKMGTGKLAALAFSLQMKGLGRELAMMKCSRNMEYEADRVAILLCIKAGFDPNHGLEFFEGRSRKSCKKNISAPRILSWPSLTKIFIEPLKNLINLLGSHPRNKERVKKGKVIASSIKDQITTAGRIKIWRNKLIRRLKGSYSGHLSRISNCHLEKILGLFLSLLLSVLFTPPFSEKQQTPAESSLEPDEKFSLESTPT